jgi:hypothetical protein
MKGIAMVFKTCGFEKLPLETAKCGAFYKT